MVSLLLTAGVFSLAVGSRVMIVAAYRLGVIALALNAVATMLLARSLRQAGLTYAAVLHIVTATYMVLFSVGNNDPRMAYVLGLCAVIEAIVFWAVAFGCETWGSDWIRSCARPLYHSTVALTVLGIPLADHSAVTMLLAAVAFLLTVKSLARAEWLYAVVAAVGGGVLFPMAGRDAADGRGRLRDGLGLRTLGDRRDDPAIETGTLRRAEASSARLRVSAVPLVDRGRPDRPCREGVAQPGSGCRLDGVSVVPARAVGCWRS